VWVVPNEEAPYSLSDGARIRFQQLRIRSGVRPGIPDVHCVVPFQFVTSRCPRGYFVIECKSKTGQLSDSQKAMQPRFVANKVPVLSMARTLEQVWAWVRALGIPIRGIS